jgi:hypothetical protein
MSPGFLAALVVRGAFLEITATWKSQKAVDSCQLVVWRRCCMPANVVCKCPFGVGPDWVPLGTVTFCNSVVVGSVLALTLMLCTARFSAV